MYLICLLLTYAVAAPSGEELRILQNKVDYIIKQNFSEKIHSLEIILDKLESKVEELNYKFKLNNKEAALSKERDLSASEVETLKNTKEVKVVQAKDHIKNIDLKNDKTHPERFAGMSDQDLYHQAIAAIKTTHYIRAVQVLQLIIQKYPKSKWISQAHYWLGEVYLQQHQLKDAKKQFEIIIAQYHKSPKHADAMLKQAGIENEEGNINRAKHLLSTIIKDYKDTQVAAQAQAALKRIG